MDEDDFIRESLLCIEEEFEEMERLHELKYGVPVWLCGTIEEIYQQNKKNGK